MTPILGPHDHSQTISLHPFLFVPFLAVTCLLLSYFLRRLLRRSSHPVPQSAIDENSRRSRAIQETDNQAEYPNLSHSQADSCTTSLIPDLTEELELPPLHSPSACGGFANVFRGTRRHNGEEGEVAVKIIRAAPKDQELADKYLRREIDIWIRLQHKNILPFYGTARIGPAIGMVSPWVMGGSLSAQLSRHAIGGPADNNKLDHFNIIHQIADGLVYLHSHLIVHGDLTGNNILLDNDGKILLCDFGLSLRVQSELDTTLAHAETSSSSVPKFTVRWTAPEIVLASDIEDSRPTMSSDVYSFSSVILHILSGTQPYGHKRRTAAIIHSLACGKFFHPPRPKATDLITDELWEFMITCWDKDPGARPDIQEVHAFVGPYDSGRSGPYPDR